MNAKLKRLQSQMDEAASIACHRAQQFGFSSKEHRAAHERWRLIWLRWADVLDRARADARQGGGAA